METNKVGGYLFGWKNGKKYLHKDANLGGYLVGKRHSQGGIKGVNMSTNQPIEVEGGEIQICRSAATSSKKYDFNGKEMTSREILSQLNQDGGGVAFEDGGTIDPKSSNVVVKNPNDPIKYEGGEIILTRGAVSNPKQYEFNGKMMTTREIASEINQNGGGVAFAEGGKTPEAGE